MARTKGSLNRDWVDTVSIIRLLGCSRDHLFRLKKDGALKHKKHWIDISREGSYRPLYRWNARAVKSYFGI